MARANAATRRKQQEAARKRRASSLKITRGAGGGQGNRNRRTSSARAGQNPERNFPATKPGQSVYREEQEARRKAGKSFNPNDKARKPSVEPGTNRLSRAIRAKERAERKAAEERAARRRQQRTTAKPTAKPTSKPKAQSGMSDLDKSIAGAQTFIATYKDKGPGMQRAVKKMKERLARLRAKKGAGKSDLAKANRNVA